MLFLLGPSATASDRSADALSSAVRVAVDSYYRGQVVSGIKQFREIVRSFSPEVDLETRRALTSRLLDLCITITDRECLQEFVPALISLPPRDTSERGTTLLAEADRQARAYYFEARVLPYLESSQATESEKEQMRSYLLSTDLDAFPIDTALYIKKQMATGWKNSFLYFF